MKSDFVRTGKRSLIGAINDGILTTRRLFINNFRDGYNQDCHDYFLGNLNPRKEAIKSHTLTRIYASFIISAFIAYRILSLLTPSGSFLSQILSRLPLFLIYTILILSLIHI